VVLGITALAASTLGFLAGLLTFKRSLRWCPKHGHLMTCEDCKPNQVRRFT
jgi:hypothetical protein